MCQLILEALHFSQEFTEAERAVLCSDRMGVRRVNPGDVLIREGERDRDMWLLLQGVFHVLKQTQPDRPLGILRDGSFCGEIAWFTGQPRTASVVAAEPGLALRLNFEESQHYPPELLIKFYHNVLADVMGRKTILHETLFKLASLEQECSGGMGFCSPVGDLQGFAFFEGFTPQEEQTLRGLKPGLETIAPGGFIHRAGEHYDSFFLLLKGSVMVTLRQDPELVLVTLGSERMLGLDSFFKDGRHEANHVAMENCQGLRIGLDAFRGLDPLFRLKIYWRMALTLVNRLAPLNLARIKLEHMEGKMWFGG
ncbi:MAG: cyclic nucleotide-binding domain-containing protein [Magnetococcales bacterium]|nr:cyclic nucleotide-binding domain-containing protein [Magnetococcales bacterium]